MVEQTASGKSGAAMTAPAPRWTIDDDEGTVEQHFAALQAAMAAAVETLAEARALDDAAEAAATAREGVPPLPLNEKSFSGSLYPDSARIPSLACSAASIVASLGA